MTTETQTQTAKDFLAATQELVVNLTETGNGRRLVAEHGKDIHYSVNADEWLIWNDKQWVTDLENLRVTEMMKNTLQRMQEEVKAERQTRLDEIESMKQRMNAMQSEANREEMAVKIAQRVEYVEKLDSALSWAKQSESGAHIRASIQLAQSEPGVSVKLTDLDADRLMFNCESGTLDLRTMELREHRRDDLCTKMSPVKWNKDATCPEFESWLNTIMLGDVETIEYLQRYIGLCLSGEIEHMIMLFFGDGRNGKSVLVDLIMRLLGKHDGYASKVAFTTFMQHKNASAGGPRSDIFNLSGHRFVSASESNKRESLDMAIIKDLTGGEEIKAREMYLSDKASSSFKPQAKFVLVSNHLPRIIDDSRGCWDRMTVMPFLFVVPDAEQDTNFAEKLFAREGEGILNWALEGWRKYWAVALPDDLDDAEAEAAIQ